MSTRSGRARISTVDSSPPKVRKGVSPPRSPARQRKSSPPARSPSRKSPSRKSPSRKPASKFPARKSPSRTTKETIETAASKSPSKRQAIKSVTQVKLEDITYKIGNLKPRSRRTEYSIQDVSSSLSSNRVSLSDKINGVDNLRNRKSIDEILPRRSSRLQEIIDSDPDVVRRSASKSLSKSISQSIDTFSDSEDELLRKKSKPSPRKLHTPLRDSVNKLIKLSSKWEFGGRIGCSILIILLPAVIFSTLISCQKSCSTSAVLNISTYKNLALWYSPLAVSAVAANCVLQAIIACLPVMGTKSPDDSGKKYCFNAFFASIVSVIILITLDYLKIISSEQLIKENLRLAVISYIIAVGLSIALFAKSRNLSDGDLNPYGNTGFIVYDFCMGGEIHPCIKNLKVKIWISRISNISALILGVLIFKHGIHAPASVIPQNATLYNIETYKEIASKVQLKPTLLIVSLMQIIYILNFIMREHKITVTFFWQYEGVGYLQTVATALYPFYFISISKYVADNNVTLSTNTLISISAIFLLGFFLMLLSNNIKYQFRANPLQNHFESMPTFHGKKLLTSSLWGILRHPNYSGDMLLHIALALPGILTYNYVAASPAIMTILLLLHRAWRDHARCNRRYGAAWQRYCKKVPSVLIPKIL